LGGILVLFIYVTSLASNEIFSISTQAFLISITFVFGVVAFTFFNDPTLWTPTSPFDQASLLDLVNEQNNIHLLLKLYNNPTHFLTLLLVVYLFLTLIAVVTITQIFEGPLRSKN
jgi:NADH-ubiquinone oxidoreductase chain 6